jgi:hypothetical protein
MRTIAIELCLGALAIIGCGPSARDDTGDDEPEACLEGGTRCAGNSFQSCTGGAWVDATECPQACSDTLGCVVCIPGTGTCNGQTANECLPDGSGYHDVFCDPVQGMSCGASGACEGACAPTSLGETYYGCDYYPVVTGNIVDPFYDFAVAIANTEGTTATITVEGGALGAPAVFTVPGGSVVVRTLPWVTALKNSTTAARATRGAYHLRSDVPVTVYQFNPLQYFKPGAFDNSYTNDASLLFPTNVWRTDHYVASWFKPGSPHPSQLAVVAHQDNTTVTITAASSTPAAGGAPAFAANVPQAVTLNAGDVIQIATTAGDLHGSHVTSDKPVQVVGGHYCANVPDTTFGYCEHLEEVMLPVDALGVSYVVNAPAVTTIPGGKEECVRIMATEPNTTLTYDPPQPGAPTSIPNAGGWVEISRQAANYLVTGNNKILVSQYMEGSTVAGNTGDPSMALAVPVEQFRTDYLFHAPTNYVTNYVDITAPIGATITLDGAPIPAIVPIGSSGWGLSRVTPLGNGPANDGNHRIMGDVGFGISVYGYGTDTSYWYPGGLDLGRIIVE